VGDLTGYSGGLIFCSSTKLDLSYAYAKRDSQQGFLQELTDGDINATTSMYIGILF
jgi:peptidoglycan biosynthesis protein MviN/MurJ (putative lipid II flippase)